MLKQKKKKKCSLKKTNKRERGEKMKQRSRKRKGMKGESWRDHRGTEEGGQSSVLKPHVGVKEEQTKRQNK